MKLTGNEFIRRFLLHVLPKGSAKSVTMASSPLRIRKPMLKKCINATGRAPSLSKFAGQTWQQVLLLARGIDVCLCPVCEKRKDANHTYFSKRQIPTHKCYCKCSLKYPQCKQAASTAGASLCDCCCIHQTKSKLSSAFGRNIHQSQMDSKPFQSNRNIAIP